jgi:hypothetical protein
VDTPISKYLEKLCPQNIVVLEMRKGVDTT